MVEIGKYLHPKSIGIILSFVALVAIADNIPVFKVVGSERVFTLFQFFGPTIGGFLGPGLGSMVILAAEVFSFIFNSKALTLQSALLFLPMVFATIYFSLYSRKIKVGAIVPLVCIVLFVLHPVGSEAWQFSLLWFIPLISMLLPNNIFLRSLGATFSAHAVGGTIWIYTFNTTPYYWLVEVGILRVILERLVFAGGIAVSYYFLTTVASKVEFLRKVNFVNIDMHYSLF
ncbi:MAG: hypothetical protein QXW70_02270 [Candidatus Anstonellales archaeon]